MRNKTVLVVDGERSVRFSLRSCLEEQGYRVVEAANAIQALVVCACDSIDLLVTEMELPGMTGPQLVSALWGPFPALPVIYMSARRERQNGNPFIPKPIEADAMIDKVRALLETPAPKKQPGMVISVRDECARRVDNGV